MEFNRRRLRQRLSIGMFGVAVIIIASLAVCDPALAQISAHDLEIARVDAAIDRVLTKQRANRGARDEINDFAHAASSWVKAAGDKGKEIAKVQRQIQDRDFSAMESGQLRSAMQTLQN